MHESLKALLNVTAQLEQALAENDYEAISRLHTTHEQRIRKVFNDPNVMIASTQSLQDFLTRYQLLQNNFEQKMQLHAEVLKKINTGKQANKLYKAGKLD